MATVPGEQSDLGFFQRATFAVLEKLPSHPPVVNSSPKGSGSLESLL